ncbi:aldo/keto reductase [Massilia sp. ZL223]|uniref:aldo/keto reductase n=1 Tax=Massilia sp. ZL223 TaxID=2824904 RepID=UPI0035A35463
MIVVQARMSSSRLPGKVMMHAAGRPMLGHQIERLRQVRNAAELVVATSTEIDDDVIAAYCAGQGVGLVRGSLDDVLARYVQAARMSDADVIVRVTGDCPLIDPAIVDEVIAAWLAAPSQRRYASNGVSRSYPRGMDVEVFPRALLEEADRAAVTCYDREHVTPWIRRVLSGTDGIISVVARERHDTYRLTLDYPSDYDNIKALLESELPDTTLAAQMQRARELNLNLLEADWQRREHGNGFVLGRVGLGAAQFGMHYGRFNVQGKPSTEVLAAILQAARGFGLSSIDTAHLYGESEAALGRCSEHLQGFQVVTKTPRFDRDHIAAEDGKRLRAAFEQSLRDLRQPAVDGLLVHHAPDLLAKGGERLYETMLGLKEEGLVRNIGVSVYSGEIAEQIQARFPLDMVQLPMNVLDQRSLTSGALSRLAAAGVRCQVRSAFLQGLLLADPAALAPFFDTARPALESFHAAARAAQVSPAHAALHFLLGIPEIDRVIVGVESVTQLEQLFASFPAAPPIDYAQFGIDIPEILNPALWPK